MSHGEILKIAAPLLIAVLLIALLALLYLRRRRKLIPTPFKDFPVQFVDAGGWTLRYHRSGKGPPLLLLHGIGANLFCWRLVVPLLTKHFTVTALDLPGFGQSSKLHGASYGLDHQVPRVAQFLDQLKIQKTYVVGSSMGGNIALWLTLLHPDRINGCAVIGPATSPTLVPFALDNFAWLLARPSALLASRQFIHWAHRRTVSKKHLVDQDRVEETFSTYGGGEAQAHKSFLLALKAIRDPRLPKALAKIKAKVLILWGSKDKLVNRAVIDALEAALPAAESHIHIGGGHHLQEDEPEWVSEKLVEFFLEK